MRDEAGFATFVAARGPALLRLAWLLTADVDAAEDLVQEALVRVVPRWDAIAEGAREAYLRTTMRSIWIDGWRRRRGFRLHVVGEPHEHGSPMDRLGALPDDDVAATAGRLTLDQSLARLTARQRAVLVLRFYEDLTETQTAQAMGCTVSTVKSQTRHALERLRVLSPGLAEAFGRAEPSSPLASVPAQTTGPAHTTSEVPS